MDNQEILAKLRKLHDRAYSLANEAGMLNVQIGVDRSTLGFAVMSLRRAEETLQRAIIEHEKAQVPPPTLGISVSDAPGIKDKPHG